MRGCLLQVLRSLTLTLTLKLTLTLIVFLRIVDRMASELKQVNRVTQGYKVIYIVLYIGL